MGNTNSRGAGGGGAGGFREESQSKSPGDVVNVVIGTGGAAAVSATTKGSTGTDTTATGFTTATGGAGGSSGGASGNGDNGASGGGAGDNNGAAGTGGTATSQGSAGGNNATSGGSGGGGGGGGGKGGVGGNATTGAGGTAGPGQSSSISGSPVTYAAGGKGQFNEGVAANGAANTGNGGEGGQRFSGPGGIGGSGIAIFSYTTGSISATGGTITTSGTKTIHTFTASGTLTFSVFVPPPTAERAGRLRPRTPAGPGRPTRSGIESFNVEVAPRISSLNPNSSRLPGGATSTLTGFSLRNNSNGSAPSVTIGGVAATSVVVVSSTSLTFTIPAGAAVGVVDVVLTIDTHVDTLVGGFTYFQETILSVTPAFGPIAGGTKVTIRGANFDTTEAYRVRFGDQFATAVSVLDSATILATTPSNPVGFVNVELVEPVLDVVDATLPSGFQYTSLIRGEDIRRNPGIQISESLGAPPSTCQFRIDGQSNAPAGGEKISILDSEDGDRLLWAGTVQSYQQIYEGQIDQLAWDTRAVDFTWLANKKRPIGSWFQVSASQIVIELVGQCCPGFTVTHVQTSLSKVTVILDGSKDLVTVLNEIAAAIGGGHWYVDFQQDFHFFHIVPASIVSGLPPLPPTSGVVGTGSFITLATGAAVGFLVSYPRGYYIIRSQNVFADGSVGALSPWSNVVQFDGSLKFSLTGIPTGPTISGNATVRRRLWFHRLSAEAGDSIYTVRPFCEITDNVTTSFTTAFGSIGASSAAVIDIAATVAVPEGANGNHPAGPEAPPDAVISAYLQGDPLAWSSNWVSFRYAFLYRDGSVSYASPGTQPFGHQYMDIGFMILAEKVTVQPGPSINTNNDCIARLIYFCQGLPEIQGYSESRSSYPIGYGYGVPGYKLKDPDWSNMVDRGFAVIPDNTTAYLQFARPKLGSDPVFGGSTGDNAPYIVIDPVFGSDIATINGLGKEVCDGNEKPFFSGADASFEFTADPVPAWPNDDGPYLEDAFPPDVIDDDNGDVLHEDSGSQGFKVTTDHSQVRNRIFVIGSGSTLAQNYVDGSLQLFPSDVTNFALGGGRLRIEDPANGHTEFANYSTLQQKSGIPYIVLTTPLSYKYSLNSIVYNYYRADDIESQKYMAKLELDNFGNQTDGVHEYTITDSSLKTVWQLYMRAQAELELYAKPIVTIMYATRDPNTRIGRTVIVDLTFPPCKGSFLIQQVTIDQIRDEGEQLAPRYTATASSIRYDLNDLLLKVLGQNGTGGVSVGGVANSGGSLALAGGTAGATSFPKARETFAFITGNTNTGIFIKGVGCADPVISGSGGTFAFDAAEVGQYQDDFGAPADSSTPTSFGTMATSATISSIANLMMIGSPARFLEDQADAWFEVKTGVNLSGAGYYIGANASSANGSNGGTNVAMMCLRYSQGTDSGWTAFFQSQLGAGNGKVSIPLGLGVTPSTIYTIRIQSFISGNDYRTVRVVFTINGQQLPSISWSQTVVAGIAAMPTVGHVQSNGATALNWGALVINLTGVGAAKKLSLRRMYVTSQA